MKNVVFASVAFAAARVCSAGPMFPMHAGEEWTYDARVHWTDGNEPRSATVPWTMKVVDVIEGPRAHAAIVRGFLMRLAWFDPTEPPAPAFDVVVARVDGLWIDTDEESEQAARAMAKRAAEGETIGHPLLRFPLRENDCVDKADPDRDDGDYCWRLMKRGSEAEPGSWRVEYRTLPDRQQIDFTEGVGFTGYVFEHHGTVASAHAVLRPKGPAN